MSEAKAVYRRVLLKLSGEALMGPLSYGFDMLTAERIVGDIRQVLDMGTAVAIVVGGGNIFRGVSQAAAGLERASADYMGMLATVMNALALQSVCTRLGVDARVQSAIPMSVVCEPYSRREAVKHLDEGRVVIFAAGTGNPFFTTDTAAALRAAEMDCDALLKGTQVDGVYDADPKKVQDATRFERVTYQDVLARDLKVMDAAAVALARDSAIPVIVFSIQKPGGFAAAVSHTGTFTMMS